MAANARRRRVVSVRHRSPSDVVLALAVNRSVVVTYAFASARTAAGRSAVHEFSVYNGAFCSVALA
jgi:hypothetical protein